MHPTNAAVPDSDPAAQDRLSPSILMLTNPSDIDSLLSLASFRSRLSTLSHTLSIYYFPAHPHYAAMDTNTNIDPSRLAKASSPLAPFVHINASASARSRLANPCTPLPPAPSAVVYGRDGSYLTESLLEKGYNAHDIIRCSSSFNTSCINLLFFGQHEHAPQSHVEVSFDMAEYTGDVDALGTLRLLDAVCTCGLQNLVRFYQASTFELYSLVPHTTLMPRITRSGLAQFIWSSSGSALQALNLPVNLYVRCVMLHGQDLTVYDNDLQTHDMTTSAAEIG
ncbi:hypothetical protein EDB85DRAFT_2230234 [Lactarius pseudohatsudake]|nr:hypothetical protein EDB85DRAFT_2230234 [Lactarius pseudohatsudake]